MREIEGKMYVNFEELRAELGWTAGALKEAISNNKGICKDIQVIYISKDGQRFGKADRANRGIFAWYSLDSLPKNIRVRFLAKKDNFDLFFGGDIFLEVHRFWGELYEAFRGVGAGRAEAEVSADKVCWVGFLSRVQLLGKGAKVRFSVMSEAERSMYYCFDRAKYADMRLFLEREILGLLRGRGGAGFKLGSVNSVLQNMSNYVALCTRLGLRLDWYARLGEQSIGVLQEFLVVDGRSKSNDGSHLRKVDERVDRVLLILFSRYKLYASDACRQFNRYVAEKGSLVNEETGEVIEGASFWQGGSPLQLSERTVARWMQHNRVRIEMLEGLYANRAKHEPFVHRRAVQYGLSKLTMDDWDLPLHSDVKMGVYIVFDVMSGAVVGYHIGRLADKGALWVEWALRSVFTNADVLMLGKMPAEIEVERHLTSSYKDTLLKTGNLFRFVTWCVARNPKEKAAERLIQEMKYGYLKEGFVEHFKGRFYNSRFGARMSKDGEEFRGVRKLTETEIIEGFAEVVRSYNHSVRKGADKSRLMTMIERVNPALLELDLERVAYYVGEATEVQVRANQYIQVRGRSYLMPVGSLGLGKVLVRLLKTHKHIVWVYSLDGGAYLGEATEVEGVAGAKVEQSEEDMERLHTFRKTRERFRERVQADKSQVEGFVLGNKKESWSDLGAFDGSNHATLDVRAEDVRAEKDGDLYDMLANLELGDVKNMVKQIKNK